MTFYFNCVSINLDSLKVYKTTSLVDTLLNCQKACRCISLQSYVLPASYKYISTLRTFIGYGSFLLLPTNMHHKFQNQSTKLYFWKVSKTNATNQFLFL